MTITVDWSSVTGVQAAQILFNSIATGQPPVSLPLTFTANHTIVPSGFQGDEARSNQISLVTYTIPIGFVEGDGAISIEAAHATRNTTVGEIAWMEIPNYGRTLSGVTPWPRLGNNEANYTAGSGPSLSVQLLKHARNIHTLTSFHTGNTTSITSTRSVRQATLPSRCWCRRP